MPQEPKVPIAEGAQLGFKHQKGGKKFPLYRVLDSKTRQPLINKDGHPVDGGGYKLPNLAHMRAKEINDYYSDE